jgi:hypothetical protein
MGWGIIALLKWITNEFLKFINWCRNPTNGKGKYVTPSKRHYLSSGMTLVAIFIYRTGEGLYNLAMSLIFDILAPLINVIIGIASDLWHSNPNYTRQALRASVFAIQIALSIVFSVAMLAVNLFRK